MELQKKKFPDKTEFITPMENAINSLAGISNLIPTIEKNFPVQRDILMSEEEIIDYLDKIEGKKN